MLRPSQAGSHPAGRSSVQKGPRKPQRPGWDTKQGRGLQPRSPTPRPPFRHRQGFLWLGAGGRAHQTAPLQLSRAPLLHLEHPRPPQWPDTLRLCGVHSRPSQGAVLLPASFLELTWQSHRFLVPTWY